MNATAAAELNHALVAFARDYPRGIKITDQELAAVPLAPHEWHGE